MSPIYMLLVSISPKFHSISLYGEPCFFFFFFWNAGNFGTSAPNYSKLILSPTMSNYPIYVSQLSPGLKCHSVSLYDQAFSSYKPFWHKCTKWAKMTLNTTRSKIHHICVTSVPESQISPRLLCDHSFSRYRTFYNSPLTAPPQKKSQNFKIARQSLNSTMHLSYYSVFSPYHCYYLHDLSHRIWRWLTNGRTW